MLREIRENRDFRKQGTLRRRPRGGGIDTPARLTGSASALAACSRCVLRFRSHLMRSQPLARTATPTRGVLGASA